MSRIGGVRLDGRHPLHRQFQLPATFVALQEHILSYRDPDDGLTGWDLAWAACGSLFSGELDPLLPKPAAAAAEDCWELAYHNQPIEIIRFATNGGDALHYGWAVLAPELNLPDHPCVSFAPVDDVGALWLGDDTRESLENLLLGTLVSRRRHGPAERSPMLDPRWSELCRRLDLHPDPASTRITAGARSDRPITPTIPPGWHHEQTPDGLGVLASRSAFHPDPPPAPKPEKALDQAKHLLDAGYPASALTVLKHTWRTRATATAMRHAYESLGRPLHAHRTELWLTHQP